jgi:hypothetical protein
MYRHCRDRFVNRTAELWARLRTLTRRNRMQLALSVRSTAAALIAFLLAQILQLPLPLWAVLTALIVTQMSVGRSLKAAFDYLLGTIGGAIYAGALGAIIPHSSEPALLAVLAAAVVPMTFVAAINPRFAAAPVTAVIVVLVPLMTHTGQVASAVDRVLEVALGGITGFAVSYVVLPSNAHTQVVAVAAQTLEQMARVLGELLSGLSKGLDMDALHRIQDGVGQALVQLNVVGAEAEHERSIGIADAPDTGPLLRTLLRLRHDLVMIGRTAISPLPDAISVRLDPPLSEVGIAFAGYLRASATALKLGQAPPSLDKARSALDAFQAEVGAVRRDGLTVNLSDEAAERFFALGFALEQMFNNFKDLERCVAESSRPSKK